MFDTVDDFVLDQSADFGNYRSPRSTGASPEPSIDHGLIYYDLAGGDKSQFDFDLDSNGQVHMILAEATLTPRILYVRGSIMDGTWNEEGFFLARFRESYLPRVAALSDANGDVHLFWTEWGGSNERLVHVRADSVGQPGAFEVVGKGETLNFLVVAMANGDIVLLCKAYNFELYLPNSIAFRVGGDFSLNLRVLRKTEWTLWKRLKYAAAADELATAGIPYLRDLNLRRSALEAVGPQKIEFIVFDALKPLNIVYDVIE